MVEKKIHKASCHCGAVRLEIKLANGISNPRRCDCSFCSLRGAIMGSAPIDDLSVTKGVEVLTEYQFNTNTARHYFCSICGIYTHHQRRSDPREFGFNVACIEGVNPFKLADVPVMDGINHPSDQS